MNNISKYLRILFVVALMTEALKLKLFSRMIEDDLKTILNFSGIKVHQINVTHLISFWIHSLILNICISLELHHLNYFQIPKMFCLVLNPRLESISKYTVTFQERMLQKKRWVSIKIFVGAQLFSTLIIIRNIYCAAKQQIRPVSEGLWDTEDGSYWC